MATVKPLHPAAKPSVNPSLPLIAPKRIEHMRVGSKAKPLAASPLARTKKPVAPTTTVAAKETLDGRWDRQLGKGAVVPDVSVDLHGSGLASAYSRLDGALEQAIAQHMRVVLLVTGHVRAHDRASGEGRGAIASVVRDWLAASRHSQAISAVRSAHPRHGGSGALYIILKR
jgi:DNA-nicking Smr family endonuclease